MSRRPRRVTQTIIDIRHAPLRGRDWLLIVVLVLVVLAVIFAARGAVFASFDASNPNYLVRRVEPTRYREADDVFSSYARALTWRNNKADIVIIGSSVAREALWREGDLEAPLSALAKRSIRVANLSSSGQGPGEMLALLDAMRLRPGTMVLMVLSPTRFFKPYDATFGVLPSDIPLDQLSFDHSLIAEAPTIAAAIPVTERLAVTAEALRRVFYRWLCIGPANYLRQHVYGIAPPQRDPYLYKDLPYGNAEQQAQHYREIVDQMQLATATDAQLNTELILATARRIRAAGGRLMVIDAPMIAGRQAIFYGAKRWHDYRALTARLHSEFSADALDINGAAALSAQDFYDSTHVGDSGRRKWSAAFVRALGPLLQQPAQGM